MGARIKLASALLHSDMDTFGDLDEFSETEAAKHVEAVRDIANDLKRRADKMKKGSHRNDT